MTAVMRISPPLPSTPLSAPGADVPEETVYNLVKTMMENADALEAVHKNAAGTCPERGIEGALIPMHPGAERYYKEVGVLD